jgi:hypothetical protein
LASLVSKLALRGLADSPRWPTGNNAQWPSPFLCANGTNLQPELLGPVYGTGVLPPSFLVPNCSGTGKGSLRSALARGCPVLVPDWDAPSRVFFCCWYISHWAHAVGPSGLLAGVWAILRIEKNRHSESGQLALPNRLWGS